MPSEEILAAYAEVSMALEKLRLAIDPSLDTVMGDWVCVAVEYNFDTPNKATYSRFFRGGGLPYHVGIGLLETGLELTQENGSADHDDD